MPAPKPTIYVIASCNGAGKTTFAKEFLPSIGVIRFLNADEIARELSPLRPEAVAFKGSTRDSRVGLKAWPSLRVRCSGDSPKQSSDL
jgi:hypothetical protein